MADTPDLPVIKADEFSRYDTLEGFRTAVVRAQREGYKSFVYEVQYTEWATKVRYTVADVDALMADRSAMALESAKFQDAIIMERYGLTTDEWLLERNRANASELLTRQAIEERFRDMPETQKVYTVDELETAVGDKLKLKMEIEAGELPYGKGNQSLIVAPEDLSKAMSALDGLPGAPQTYRVHLTEIDGRQVAVITNADPYARPYEGFFELKERNITFRYVYPSETFADAAKNFVASNEYMGTRIAAAGADVPLVVAEKATTLEAVVRQAEQSQARWGSKLVIQLEAPQVLTAADAERVLHSGSRQYLLVPEDDAIKALDKIRYDSHVRKAELVFTPLEVEGRKVLAISRADGGELGAWLGDKLAEAGVVSEVKYGTLTAREVLDFAASPKFMAAAQYADERAVIREAIRYYQENGVTREDIIYRKILGDERSLVNYADYITKATGRIDVPTVEAQERLVTQLKDMGFEAEAKVHPETGRLEVEVKSSKAGIRIAEMVADGRLPLEDFRLAEIEALAARQAEGAALRTAGRTVLRGATGMVIGGVLIEGAFIVGDGAIAGYQAGEASLKQGDAPIVALGKAGDAAGAKIQNGIYEASGQKDLDAGDEVRGYAHWVQIGSAYIIPGPMAVDANRARQELEAAREAFAAVPQADVDAVRGILTERPITGSTLRTHDGLYNQFVAEMKMIDRYENGGLSVNDAMSYATLLRNGAATPEELRDHTIRKYLASGGTVDAAWALSGNGLPAISDEVLAQLRESKVMMQADGLVITKEGTIVQGKKDGQLDRNELGALWQKIGATAADLNPDGDYVNTAPEIISAVEKVMARNGGGGRSSGQ